MHHTLDAHYENKSRCTWWFQRGGDGNENWSHSQGSGKILPRSLVRIVLFLLPLPFTWLFNVHLLTQTQGIQCLYFFFLFPDIIFYPEAAAAPGKSFSFFPHPLNVRVRVWEPLKQTSLMYMLVEVLTFAADDAFLKYLASGWWLRKTGLRRTRMRSCQTSGQQKRGSRAACMHVVACWCKRRGKGFVLISWQHSATMSSLKIPDQEHVCLFIHPLTNDAPGKRITVTAKHGLSEWSLIVEAIGWCLLNYEMPDCLKLVLSLAYHHSLTRH